MRRRHIAVFTVLANGHVYPVLGLCSELAKRGYRVTYATDDHYSQMICGVGAEPVFLKSKAVNAEFEKASKEKMTLPVNDPKWWIWTEAAESNGFDELKDTVSELQDLYRDNVPDVVLYDRYFTAARILAHRLGVPAIQMSPNFAYYKNFIIRENGVCRNPEPVLESAKRLDSFLATEGITTKDNLWHTEALNIYSIPRAFQYHSDCFDERFCFAGPLLNRPFRPTWTNNSNGKPIVLVSGLSGPHGYKLGMDSHFKVVIDALSNSECHCILSTGDNLDERSFGPLPDNFEINRRASHLEILPHAAVAICHAGIGSTLEALYNGVPVLGVPTYPPCDEIAYRVAELGLGIRLSKHDLTVDSVRIGVGELLGDTMLRNRVKEMQQVFKSSGGAPMAVDRIDRFFDEM